MESLSDVVQPPHMAPKETDMRKGNDPPTVRREVEVTAAGLWDQDEPCRPHMATALGQGPA